MSRVIFYVVNVKWQVEMTLTHLQIGKIQRENRI